MVNNPEFRPLFLSKVTIEATVPAIRHHGERALKRYEVCEKGCRDKTQCSHRFKLKEPVYYTSCLGELIPKRIALDIGGQTAMRTNFYQQEILDDLSVPRMQNTDEEVGRHYTEGDQIDWARSSPELVVTNTVLFPPFQNTSLGLPVLLFWQSPITLKIELCKLNEAYFSNDAKLPKLLYEDRDLNKRDIKIRCFVEVLQCQDERLMNNLNFLAKPITYYWPYFENHSGMLDVEGNLDRDKGWNTITVPIRNELLEILWILVPHRKASGVNGRAQFVPSDRTQNPFNWSGHNGEDPITQAELSINNVVEVTARDAKCFRSNSHKLHLNKPKAKIYGYSYSPVPNRAEINCGSLSVIPHPNDSHVPIHIRLKFQPYVMYCKRYVLNSQAEPSNVAQWNQRARAASARGTHA